MPKFQLAPPQRILLGPGPSEVPRRVLNAGSLPAVGYLDPSFIELMKVVQEQLREMFLTENRYTLTITGAGTAAMECAIDNLCEPGDTVVFRSLIYVPYGETLAGTVWFACLPEGSTDFGCLK